MNSPKNHKDRSHGALKLYWWLLLMALILAACVPVTPAPEAEGQVSPVVTEIPAAEAEPATPAAMESTADDSTKVAILVVDFFGAPVEPLGSWPDSNCLAAPNGTRGEGNHGSSGANGGVVVTNIPHGELVYDHLIQQFGSGTRFDEVFSAAIPGLQTVVSTTVGASEIYLVKLDIGGNLTGAVLRQITGVRDWLKSTYGVDYFVVNLSLIVKPCQTMFPNDPEGTQFLQFVQCIPILQAQREHLDPFTPPDESSPIADPIIREHAEIAAAFFANPFGSQQEPMPAIECAEGVDVGDDLAGVVVRSAMFYLRLLGDPLLQAAMGTSGDMPTEDTFYIAASGNDGYPYPFAPALFRQVVSTGSIPVADDPLYLPNAAEWILDDRYTFTPEAGDLVTIYEYGVATEVLEGQPVTLVGTSFATAKLSYLSAIALAHDSTVLGCYPEMTYAAGLLGSLSTWEEWLHLSEEDIIPPDYIWENREASVFGHLCPTYTGP